MNSYERYMAMVHGQKVDIVPRIPLLMHFAADYIGASYSDFASDPNVMADANLKLAEDFGVDAVDILSDPYREMTAFGGEIEYRSDTTPKCVTIPLEHNKDIGQLLKPDVEKSIRLATAVKTIGIYRKTAYKKYSITGWVEGPVAEAADLRTVGTFMMDLIDDPPYCQELMEICINSAAEFAGAQIKAGADTMGIGDAIASQVSLDIYEKLIFPKELKLVKEIHNMGGLARLHICGDINRLLPLIGQLGIDILDCDHMVDMKLARKCVGDKCVLTGNLDPVSGVLQGKPEDIKRYFSELYQEIGNPFFVNGGCEIPRGTPDENLRALCEPIAGA
ncbi:MAG: uroporphyrinogen decarboxylase family protein [Anaerohalosphaeraceae bacterium]|nr:uroporphyrinogen decarboxylase family protein [Anaerohalosphaeraceae bacterium]